MLRIVSGADKEGKKGRKKEWKEWKEWNIAEPTWRIKIAVRWSQHCSSEKTKHRQQTDNLALASFTNSWNAEIFIAVYEMQWPMRNHLVPGSFFENSNKKMKRIDEKPRIIPFAIMIPSNSSLPFAHLPEHVRVQVAAFSSHPVKFFKV